MHYKEFVRNVDTDTPEKILLRISSDGLKDYADKLFANAQAHLIFEESKIEGIYFSDTAFFMISCFAIFCKPE